MVIEIIRVSGRRTYMPNWRCRSNVLCMWSATQLIKRCASSRRPTEIHSQASTQRLPPEIFPKENISSPDLNHLSQSLRQRLCCSSNHNHRHRCLFILTFPSLQISRKLGFARSQKFDCNTITFYIMNAHKLCTTSLGFLEEL